MSPNLHECLSLTEGAQLFETSLSASGTFPTVVNHRMAARIERDAAVDGIAVV